MRNFGGYVRLREPNGVNARILKDHLESSLEVVTFRGRCAMLVNLRRRARALRDVRSARIIFTRLEERIRIVGIVVIS